MGFANYARAALERFKCVLLSLVGSGKEDDELGLVSGERRRRREIEARNILTHVRNNQLIWGRTQNEIFWRLGVGQMINVQVEWNKSMRGEKKKKALPGYFIISHKAFLLEMRTQDMQTSLMIRSRDRAVAVEVYAKGHAARPRITIYRDDLFASSQDHLS